MSCSTNSERLTIEVSKFGKAISKNLNDEEHGQSEYEELEAFERAILLLSYILLKASFSMDESYNGLKIFRWKFLIVSITRRDKNC